MSAQPTPRPWFAHFNNHGDPSIVTDHAQPGFTQIAELSTMPEDYGKANAVLIEAAINDYDRLLAVEAAARAWSEAEAKHAVKFHPDNCPERGDFPRWHRDKARSWERVERLAAALRAALARPAEEERG